MSLIATRVQAWRISAPQFDKNMTRPSEYGALDFFVQQTDSGRSFVTPELASRALASIGTTLQIPVIDFDGDVTVSNVRSCVIADNENTSKLYTVVFATYAVGFTMVPALYLNNNITYEHDFQRKMEKVTRALGDALDKGAIAALEANKTQVFRETLNYVEVGNTLDVPWDMREEILGDLNPMMRANDYRGQMHLIGNAGIDSLINKLAQKGLYNEVNKQLEYAGKVFHFTNNMVNEVGDYGTTFAVEDGNVGYVTRAGRENLLRSVGLDHEFDIVKLPILEIPVDTHFYKTIGDQSAIAGESSVDMNCNFKEHYSFAVDVAFLVSYNSDPATIANPIMKVAIDRADVANPYARPVRVVNDEQTPIYTAAVGA